MAFCNLAQGAAQRGESFSWYGHGTAANDRPDQFEQLSFPPEGCVGVKMVWSDNPAFSTSLNGGNEFLEALRSSNVECAVARALERYGGAYEGLLERMTRDKTVEDQIRDGYENCGFAAADKNYETFKARQYQLIPTVKGWESQRVGLSGFAQEPERFSLETPTGKIEFYATGLAQHFPDDALRGPVAH